MFILWLVILPCSNKFLSIKQIIIYRFPIFLIRYITYCEFTFTDKNTASPIFIIFPLTFSSVGFLRKGPSRRHLWQHIPFWEFWRMFGYYDSCQDAILLSRGPSQYLNFRFGLWTRFIRRGNDASFNCVAKVKGNTSKINFSL